MWGRLVTWFFNRITPAPAIELPKLKLAPPHDMESWTGREKEEEG